VGFYCHCIIMIQCLMLFILLDIWYWKLRMVMKFVLFIQGVQDYYFFLIFIHIGRGIWYKSYYLLEVWESGVLIFLILIMVSFLGYVLPWGQISFWAATVITNLLYVIPYVGGIILEWVWGGFSVGGPTLSRFFYLTLYFSFCNFRVKFSSFNFSSWEWKKKFIRGYFC